MADELVIIIVGVVLLLVAIIDGSASLNLLQNRGRIPTGILGLLLIIYGGYAYGAVNMQAQIEQVDIGKKRNVNLPVSRVQVVSPLDQDSVQCRILTMGYYPKNHEKDIWVLLKPSDDRYYPQSDHTNTSYKRNEEWQVITRFGGDMGERYELIVYETDEAASRFFTNTIETWKESNSYPGIEHSAIPAGAREVDRLTVYLQENCRGVF